MIVLKFLIYFRLPSQLQWDTNLVSTQKREDRVSGDEGAGGQCGSHPSSVRQIHGEPDQAKTAFSGSACTAVQVG